MANGSGKQEGIDAFVPVLVIGAAMAGAYYAVTRRATGGVIPPGSAVNWSILGLGGSSLEPTARLGSLVTVKVDNIELPHDTVEIWGYKSVDPVNLPEGNNTFFGNGLEPFQQPIPLTNWLGGLPYFFVVLQLRKNGMVVAQGDNHQAGYDPRLRSAGIRLV